MGSSATALVIEPPVSVMVARLDKLYDPFGALGDLPRQNVYDAVEPLSAYVEEGWLLAEEYDIRRIRYFRDVFRSGGDVDPIEIDCVCSGNRIYPRPVIVDGHHRLCGAILARRRRISATFGGRLDLLDYLVGKRRSAPQE